MSTGYDAVVVGARVAGASTAMLLARAGARVAVVDRAAYGTDTVSTHALMRAGVVQLSRWGLLDGVVSAGTPAIRRTTFHYADGESVAVDIRPSIGADALYAPRRPLLDRLLVDAAVAAGADVRHETSVTALLHDRAGRVSGVQVRDRWGKTSELRGAITVGADGLRSVVAEQAGAPLLRRGRARSAVLYRYYAGIPAAGYEWAYAPGMGAGLIPTNDGLTCVFVGTTPARMRRLRRGGAEHAFATLLAQGGVQLAERVASGQPAGRMHGWAGVAGVARRPWGPGWALVGDAGYYRDPLTTHGITDALRDAELLADEILETLAGATAENVALGRYQAMRDRLSGPLFDATEPVASYDWDLVGLRRLLLRVSAAMGDEVEYLQALPERRADGERRVATLTTGRC
ncbi:MAG TPA: NAD(P)/FAD-dependent oxidoreductase [Jatrophihabitans sp.]|nr:NAD(P)/FAD-dependent oxidoreductase [Jatrophihabitans sp.]